MDGANLRNMHRICGGDFAGKLHLLMDYTDHPHDVADPWYTCLLYTSGLYQGAGKTVCVPGLNCYSCPAASGACPIGAFQAVVGSSKFSFSYYITGFLILLGVLLGRFICGFLCPFGWFQELLHKIPTKKLSTKKLMPLT